VHQQCKVLRVLVNYVFIRGLMARLWIMHTFLIAYDAAAAAVMFCPLRLEIYGFKRGICSSTMHTTQHTITQSQLLLLLFTNAGWKIYGFNRGECNGKTGIWFREW
jgi:hypothetical protein